MSNEFWYDLNSILEKSFIIWNKYYFRITSRSFSHNNKKVVRSKRITECILGFLGLNSHYFEHYVFICWCDYSKICCSSLRTGIFSSYIFRVISIVCSIEWMFNNFFFFVGESTIWERTLHWVVVLNRSYSRANMVAFIEKWSDV